MASGGFGFQFVTAISLAALVLGSQAYADDRAENGPPKGYRLVWSDEFNKDGLPNEKNWGYSIDFNKRGWTNNEKQYYSAHRLKNSRVENGLLIIEAHKEDMSSEADYGGQSYSSARLTTRNKAMWTYGYFEVRAKLPCGIGQWPAIWLIGEGTWPDSGEIDIMEAVGFHPTTIYGSVHTAASEHTKTLETGKVEVADYCSAFHNYQLDWQKDTMVFLVDGVPYYRYDRKGKSPDQWPFDRPEHLILNIAIGGVWGGQKGIDDKALPAQMQIDYVRVYQKP